MSSYAVEPAMLSGRIRRHSTGGGGSRARVGINTVLNCWAPKEPVTQNRGLSAIVLGVSLPWPLPLQDGLPWGVKEM